MTEPVSLSAHLSHALVAFTIEVDNELEHRMVHRTTRGREQRGPWLTSLVMYANGLRHIDADGTSIADLVVRARTTRLSLGGLERWGYVAVEGDAVRLKPSGVRAKEQWAPLRDEVEARWRVRFGPAAIDRLRDALGGVRTQLPVALPEYLPVVVPTQNERAEVPSPAEPPTDVPATDGPATDVSDLSVLLAQVLLAFTLDFEAESKLSLPISANPLRVLQPRAVRVRDLPALTGVSKEANSMATGFLVRRECAVVEPDPTGRGSIVRLTGKGERAQAKYRRVLIATDAQWRSRFGDELGEALDAIVGDDSRLREGMRPYPDGWRAKLRAPTTLPHYPMVLHRGGYPDGS